MSNSSVGESLICMQSNFFSDDIRKMSLCRLRFVTAFGQSWTFLSSLRTEYTLALVVACRNGRRQKEGEKMAQVENGEEGE